MSLTALLPTQTFHQSGKHDELTAAGAPSVRPPTKVARLAARDLHLVWLERLEVAFERVVLRSLKRAVYPVARHFTALTAQGEPEPLGESFVSADDLAQIRTVWATQVAEELLPLLGETYMTGAQGVALAVAGASTEVPDVVSIGAQEWLTLAENRMVRVGDTAWLAARGELLEGFQRGESIDDLAKRVRLAVDVSAARARTVARTEVIGASNAGSYAQARVMGVTTKTWVNTDDPRTRPSHVRAGEQTVGIDDVFNVGGARMRFPHDPLGPAGETINCVIGSTEVDAPITKMAMRSWYEGDVFTIHTAAGVTLTVTPNHPILTAIGWQPAYMLKERDYVLRGFVGRKVGREYDVQHTPVQIEQVFKTSSLIRNSKGERFPANFHGEWRQCEIGVVAEDRMLGFEVEPASMQEIEKFALTATDLPGARFGTTEGRFLPLGRTGRLSDDELATSDIRVACECATFGHRQPLHSKTIDLRSTSEWNVMIEQHSSYCGARNLQLLTDPEYGFALFIERDHVVSIDRCAFSGHVYNLTTSSGWYTGNSIITRNCRCVLVFDDKPLCACTPAWVKKEVGPLTSAGPPDCGCSDDTDQLSVTGLLTLHLPRKHSQKSHGGGPKVVRYDDAGNVIKEPKKKSSSKAASAAKSTKSKKAKKDESVTVLPPPSNVKAKKPTKPGEFGEGAAGFDKEAAHEFGEEGFSDWRKSLSPEERAGVRAYTNSDMSRGMNDRLRGVELSAQDQRRSAAIDKHVTNARSAFDKPTARTPRAVTSHRGMQGPIATQLIKAHRQKQLVGAEFQDKGLISTSLDRSIAMRGSVPASQRVRMEIDVPKGQRAIYPGSLSRFDVESELILPPGTRFRVTEAGYRQKVLTVKVSIVS